MGDQVEYLLKLKPPDADKWLAHQFDGWIKWDDEEAELPYGEFHLWDDQYLHVELGPAACYFKVPRVFYSWLIYGHPPAVAYIQRFEELIMTSLPDIPGVRVDELLLHEWEAAIGRPWQTLPDPVDSLRSWQLSSGQDARYFRFFPIE